MRRLLNNEVLVKEFGIDVAAVLQDASAQEASFYRFFPKQVEQGPQKAPTFKWLVTRCAEWYRQDGSEGDHSLAQLYFGSRDKEA